MFPSKEQGNITDKIGISNNIGNKLTEINKAIMIYFAKNLKILRDKTDISQAQLGKMVDRRSTAVSSWENGQSEPSLSDIVVIANFFGIQPGDLVFSDLSHVQVSIASGKSQNVQENVQVSVQAMLNKSGKNTPFAGESTDKIELIEAKSTIDTLRIAVKGLEAANALFINEIKSLKEENMTLKKGFQSLGEGTDNPKARTAG